MKTSIRNAFMATVLVLLVNPPTASALVKAPSIEDAAAAAKAIGCEDKTFPKSGEPYSTSKTIDKKEYRTFKAFPRSKTDSTVKQIGYSCIECKSKKMTENFGVSCYEDIQALARALKIDLPGAIIRAFEDRKLSEQTWEGKDKATEKFRYSPGPAKCEGLKSGGYGIRFDVFFK